jgi:hypothetical protein
MKGRCARSLIISTELALFPLTEVTTGVSLVAMRKRSLAQPIEDLDILVAGAAEALAYFA